MYRSYVSDPGDLAFYVGKLVGPAGEGLKALDGQGAPLDRNRLVVLLRPDAYLKSAEESRVEIVWRPFAGDMIAVLAQEDQGMFRYHPKQDLAAAGLNEVDAWALALDNLRKQHGSMQRTPNQAGAEHVTAPSGVATGFLALPESCQVDGPDYDAHVVDRDSYFRADLGKPDASPMLAGYVAELLASPPVYSSNLLSCLDGHWYASVYNGAGASLPLDGRSANNAAHSERPSQ
jgi:hypothetical protein